jgi:hypothetical protein
VVPAKFVSAAVTMLTDALAQLLDFVDQFLTCHLTEIFIHDVSSAMRSDEISP